MMRSSACAELAHGRDAATLRVVEPLVLQHLQHAEHAVHRGADLVTHGGKEGGLGLVGRLGTFLGGRQHFFAVFRCGRVDRNPQQAAVGEWHKAIREVSAGQGAAFEAVAARPQDQRQALAHLGFHVIDRPVLATLSQETHRVSKRRAQLCNFRRVALLLDMLTVDKPQAQLPVEYVDAFGDIVDHGLQQLASAFDVGARGFGGFLRFGERFLALLQLRDVAVDAENRSVLERLVADLDVMTARRGPLEANAARRAQMVDQLLDLCLDVVDLAEVAALDLESTHLGHHAAGEHDVGRIALEFHHALVDEIGPHVVAHRSHERDTVIHIVDHGGEDFARALGVGARRLRRLLGDRQLLFALLELGDVAVDAEQAAVGERLVVELDVAAADRQAVVAHAARGEHHFAPFAHQGLDVLDRTEIAALGLETDDVLAGISCRGDLGWDPQRLHEFVVAEPEAELLVEQDNAVIHVVEHGLQDLAGVLDIRLGGGQRLLALLEVGDVAVEPEPAAVAQRLERELDVSAGGGAPLVAASARLHRARRQLLDLACDVGDRAVIAAFDQNPDQITN